jgi:hypothetical protein
MLSIDRLILRLPPELAPRKRAISRALRAELARLELSGSGLREAVALPPISLRHGETNAALARRISAAFGQSLTVQGSGDRTGGQTSGRTDMRAGSRQAARGGGSAAAGGDR